MTTQTTAPTTTFYYDGDCGLCAAFTRRVARLDRKGRVAWIPYQSLGDTPSPSMGEHNETPSPSMGEHNETPSPLTGEGWDGGDNPAVNPIGASLAGARAKAPSPAKPAEASLVGARAITLADMERAAYTITPNGEIAEGYHAIRTLFRIIPTLAPIGFLMTIPGASLIGVPLYRLIANNRRRISKTCRLKPQDPT